MKKQLRSFGHALVGIGNALRTEAHLRFHLAAALLVLTAAAICGFSPERLAVLWVLSGLVIALELVNTAIEHACDAVTRDCNAHIKLAKDMAAGAVLAASIAAVAVAALFFLNGEAWNAAVQFFCRYPFAAIPLGALALLCLLFVLFGGGKKKK